MFKYERMLSYCLKCKKNTESINPKISANSNIKNDIIKVCYMWF